MARAPDAEDRLFVGIVHLLLRVPGARSRKDRRQTVSSVRDRLRHRFEVSVHEIGTGGDPGFQTLVITSASNDPRLLRSVLDQCVAVVHAHPVAEAAQVHVDVFRWQPSEADWASRMMAELGEDGNDG